MFVYWKKGFVNTYNLALKKKKRALHLIVIVLAIVKPNPIILALPAFLVLLGEGRHPAMIYRENWEAPAMVQCGDYHFKNKAELRF